MTYEQQPKTVDNTLRARLCKCRIWCDLVLVVISYYAWQLLLNYAYFSNHFDLISTLANYMTLFSGGCVIAAFLKHEGEGSKAIGRGAIICFLLSILTLILIKNTTLNYWGMFRLLPVNIFFFLFLVKNIWFVLSRAQCCVKPNNN